MARRSLFRFAASILGAGALGSALLLGHSSLAGELSSPVSAVESGSTVTMPAAGEVTGPFQVIKVVDGDTIWVDRSGQRVKVRLTGLNTPETKDPRVGVQCFGKEASQRATQLLDRQSVYLEHDTTQDNTDRYGRELAYVWTTTGVLVNLAMIRDGFGHEYTYDVPYRYQQQFRSAEAEARTNGRGLWSPAACGDAGASAKRWPMPTAGHP